MLYTLNENVYIVLGKSRSCVYDFNSLKLYNLNMRLSLFIKEANEIGISQDADISYELRHIIDDLMQCGILRLSNEASRQYIEELKKDVISIKMAWIEITQKCNLRCIHCYNESSSQCLNVMPYDDFKLAVDSIVNLGIKRIQIIGGEPFYDKKTLKKMLNYVVGRFDFIEIFTNGTLLSSDWYTFLFENNIHIALSVYSYLPEMHDYVTRLSGSWKLTNETIRKLKQYNIPYRVCNVLMNGVSLGNCSTELYKLSEKHDIVRLSGRANTKLLSENLIRKKLITKKNFQAPLNKEYCVSMISGNYCFNNKIYVASNLDVFPCVMERRIKHCNLRESKKIVIDANICTLSKDKVDDCSVCEFRYTCYDCRPNTATGILLEKPWYCTYNPSLGIWEDEDIFVKRLKTQWNINGREE